MKIILKTALGILVVFFVVIPLGIVWFGLMLKFTKLVANWMGM